MPDIAVCEAMGHFTAMQLHDNSNNGYVMDSASATNSRAHSQQRDGMRC